MKNLVLLIILALTSTIAFGQSQQKINVDKVSIGTSSAHDTELEISGSVIKKNKTTNKIQFTNDGTIWKNLGSGSGGGAGAISILENGGFEDGLDSGWIYTSGVATEAAEPLIGDKSAQFDPTALNDYLRTIFITIPKGLRGQACEARFLYTGGDANIYASVETESGVVLGRYQRPEAGSVVYGLPAHASSGYESIFYKCPTEADVTALSTNGNIRLTIYQGTATDAASMVVDDVHFGALIGLAEATTPDVFSFRVNATTGAVEQQSTGLISSCSKTGTGLFDCVPSGLTLPPNCSCTIGTGANSAECVVNASASLISIKTSNPTTGALQDYTPYLICSKQGADAKQSVQVYKGIPKISENIGTLSVRLSSAGAVESQNFTGISGSATVTNTSQYALNFVSGAYTQTPSCTCTVRDSGASAVARDCHILTASPTSVSYQTILGTSLVAMGADLNCVAQGGDYKLPTVQPVIIGQVTNSVAESALDNVRIESCRINNNGSASIDTASGLCPSWVQSVSRSVAGTVGIAVYSGVFSATPTCSISSNITTVPESYVAALGPTDINTILRNSSGTATDAAFTITCMGKR